MNLKKESYLILRTGGRCYISLVTNNCELLSFSPTNSYFFARALSLSLQAIVNFLNIVHIFLIILSQYKNYSNFTLIKG